MSCPDCRQVPGKNHYDFCGKAGERVPFTPSLQLPSQRILGHLADFLSEHYLFWQKGEEIEVLRRAEITVLGKTERMIQISVSHNRVSHLLQYTEKTGELISASRKSASNRWEKLLSA